MFVYDKLIVCGGQMICCTNDCQGGITVEQLEENDNKTTTLHLEGGNIYYETLNYLYNTTKNRETL